MTGLATWGTRGEAARRIGAGGIEALDSADIESNRRARRGLEALQSGVQRRDTGHLPDAARGHQKLVTALGRLQPTRLRRR